MRRFGAWLIAVVAAGTLVSCSSDPPKRPNCQDMNSPKCAVWYPRAP